jgi:prolyl-tRNA synthetase
MVVIGDESDPQRAVANELRSKLVDAGLEVLFDDRAAGPGAKFADAELIGCPVRVTIGKRTATEGSADVQVRQSRDQRPVAVGDVAAAVQAALSEA